MTPDQELQVAQLIQQYKRDFEIKTGRRLVIRIALSGVKRTADDIESELLLPVLLPYWTLIQLIIDATGWVAGKHIFTASRQTEFIYRRSVVDLFAVAQGYTLTAIGRETDRDHTTIIHSIDTLKDKILSRSYYHTAVTEILNHCRVYAGGYVGRDFTKAEVMSGISKVARVPADPTEV